MSPGKMSPRELIIRNASRFVARCVLSYSVPGGSRTRISPALRPDELWRLRLPLEAEQLRIVVEAYGPRERAPLPSVCAWSEGAFELAIKGSVGRPIIDRVRGSSAARDGGSATAREGRPTRSCRRASRGG